MTGARARDAGKQWKEQQEAAAAGIRESARADSILWMNNWPMLVYAGFSYVTADFSLAGYRIQLLAIPVR